MKLQNRMLFQVGLLVAVLFSAAAIINGFSIYRSSSDGYLEMLEKHTGEMLTQVRATVEEYRALPWLLDYWQVNHAALDLPGGREERAARVARALLDRGIVGLKAVTAEQAESLPEPLRREFAEECYLALMPQFYAFKASFDTATLQCVAVLTEESAFPFFLSLQEGEKTAYGNFCALGEAWPFNASLHPAVTEMLTAQEDRVYYETVTSTFDGTGYLFGYIPIMADGGVRAHLCASFTTTELRHAIGRNTREIEWVNAVVLLLSAALMLFLLRRSVLHPLSAVQKGMQGYRTTMDAKKAKESMERIRFTNEIGALADDFVTLTEDITRYTNDVSRLSAENERVSTELNMAAKIQANVLPNTFPAFPTHREFDIFATMDPAKEVGGDFYDFFLVDDDHLALVMADVSGKGVPAALFMMTARTVLKTKARSNPALSPRELLEDANAALCENNKDRMFVTVWFGVLEISTGRLTYADAGHEKLLLYQNGEWRLLPKKTFGPALAMWRPEDFAFMTEQYRYRDETIVLNPGDAIFQYTDGVTEATTAELELFGEERLLDAVNGAPSSRPAELLPHVRAKIDAFVKGAAQFDDITMLGLRYNGESTGQEKSI